MGRLNRLMVAGTGSGCGKTTVSCGLLSAFKKMGKRIVSFKCGPDYIDPMFHKKASLAACYNLDVFLMGEESVRASMWQHGKDADFCFIEGAMGFYDGLGSADYASANYLSCITQTPVVLVVDAKGKSRSICAEIGGYLNYHRNNIRAVILNNIKGTMYTFYKSMIEEELSVDVLGFMPSIPEAQIESRHLGLVSVDEIEDIRKKIDILGESAAKNIDLERLLEIAKSAEPIAVTNQFPQLQTLGYRPQIYVSKDDAFNFYYEDNHELLEAFGARLRFFSPLCGGELPREADGIILWGGYPELFAERLADNLSMLSSIRRRIEGGLPVYAECGGFIYLHEYLTDIDNVTYPMVGVISGKARMTGRLQRFGYTELTANHNNMLCEKGYKINSHSFRYSVSDNDGDAFTAVRRRDGEKYRCIVANENIFAGYPHVHFGGHTELAKRFVVACAEYGMNRRETFQTEAQDGLNI